MDTSKLRPDTAALWNVLQDHPLMNGFILIGGTALALRIGHRVSEDLDFAYVRGNLPGAQLGLLKRRLGQSGIRLEPDVNPADEELFLNDGLILANYQQNYLANGSVRLTFVAPENELRTFLQGEPGDALRVATTDEIFASKSLVCAERSKSRDWYDLYVLMTRHGYTMGDFHRTFIRIDSPAKFGIASGRLRLCRPLSDDEGYEQLLDAPPTLDDMRLFFNAQLDALETQLA
ncbi:nucleotidyl transferase AbiEii/AbiGii toxin family protein, partial [Noviherbaspirillum sp.]|uniref:nucleotidyl transferase AbiEii/AbiGii toxin family protein n=1 Tax=Noviherbaspirillum sp. TaxID=1926288 RepID=UPI002FE3CB57